MIPAISAALALLLSVPQAAPLVAAAQARQLAIVDGPPPSAVRPGVASFFQPDRDHPLVWIGPEYASARAEVLAAEIAHELVHADDFATGRLAVTPGPGCYDNEVRALKMQAIVWRALEPADGLPSDWPTTWGRMASWNEALAGLAEGPYLETWLHIHYAQACEPG
jgi:hypothetical protein